jgi:hypothetical protein
MSKKTQRNLASFRAAHDKNVIIPNKIRAALAQMEAEEGSESYAYEANDPEGRPTFLKRAGISVTELAMFREQFADYIVELGNNSRDRGKRVWFATTKAAKAARG